MRRGNYHIDIYERRPDPRSADVSKDRTFPISLQERGRKAIRAIVGLEEAIAAQSTFCQGTIISRKKGKFRQVTRPTPILTIDRNCLVTILLKVLVLGLDTVKYVTIDKFGFILDFSLWLRVEKYLSRN